MIHRGDLYYITLNKKKRGQIGHILTKERPALVISNDGNNCFARTVNVIPLTSSFSASRVPYHIMVRGFGLNRTSYAVCEQISTIDVTELKAEKYIGTITDDNLLRKIVNGVITQIGCSA